MLNQLIFMIDQLFKVCHPGLDTGSMASAVSAQIRIHGLRIKFEMTKKCKGAIQNLHITAPTCHGTNSF